MTLTSTDAGATAAPLLDLYRDSASPAATDTLGEIEFNGEDSAGNKQTYGVIHGSILSPTSTAEQGQLHFETATAGALTEKMIIGTTNLVINEPGSIFNVRIEGDTDANLFYTDATNSRVGVGTISPSEKLDVVGKIKLSDNLIIGTAAKGIDFSANTGTAGMTSELLDWYEEGTWTPSVGGNATYYGQVGNYTRVGNKVYVSGSIIINVLGTGSATIISGLPFAATNAPAGFIGFSNFANLALAVTFITGYADGSSTITILSSLIAATSLSSNNVIGDSTRLDFAGTYLV
jgi:hypothetical protein